MLGARGDDVVPHATVHPERLVFVGGLHRSGTTALGRILSHHPEVSGLTRTGVREDEGQHLQSVYAAAHRFGGPGRFARDPDAHLTALDSHRASHDARALLAAWSPHWDLSRRLLVEKSPPNIIMGRYLQSVFPGSALVVIVRHPVVVSLATRKWRRFTPLERLVQHWFVAHDILRADAVELDRLLVLRYEDLIARPDDVLGQVQNFLGLGTPLDTSLLDTTRSNPYLQAWADFDAGGPLRRHARGRIERRFGSRAQEWGYDITRLSASETWSFDRQMR